MATIIKVTSKVTGGDERFDDTITDRLNHVTTTAILIIMSVLVSTKQYVGSPIQCWSPKDFNGNQADYVDNVCWIKGTYHVPFDREHMPSVHGRGRAPTVTYYQWVPLILLVQAFFFALPCMIWRTMQARSGFDVNNFIEFGKKVSSPKVKNDIRGTLLDHMTLQVERYLKYGSTKNEVPKTSFTVSIKHLFSRTCCRCFGHRRLNYFCFLQVAVKFLYLVNSVAQIFILDYLLNMSFHSYGSDILTSLAWNSRSGPWWQRTRYNDILRRHQENRFPKVTMCDFKIRRLGATHNYSVQCALTVNLFNEKVFLILWFWMVFVCIANFLSLFRWTLRNSIRGERYRYIKNLLLISGLIEPIKKKSKGEDALMTTDFSTNSSNANNFRYASRGKRASMASTDTTMSTKYSKYQVDTMPVRQEEDSKSSDENVSRNFERAMLVSFVRNHLGPDGVLLLHLLNQASNTIVVMETLERLWINFREKCESIRHGRHDHRGRS